MPRLVYSSSPVGQLLAAQITHTAPPKGFLYCDGSTLSKTTYAALYAAIVGQVPETSTTFNLPDLRGRFLRSLDTTAATIDPDKATRTGGDANKLGSTQSHALTSHTHSLTLASTWGTGSGGPNGNWSSGDTTKTSSYTNTVTANTGSSTESRPKNFATNYFIRY